MLGTLTRTWILLGLMAGILVASAGGGVYFTMEARERALSEYQNLQQHTADEIAALIETNITATAKTLVATASALPDEGSPLEPAARKRIGELFAQRIYCRMMPCFSSIVAFDRDGRALVTSGSNGSLDPAAVADGLEWSSDPARIGLVRSLVVSEAPPAVVVITPVPHGGPDSVPAMLAGRVELTDIFERQRQAGAGSGQYGDTFVMDRQGWVVYHSAHPEMRLNNINAPSPRCFSCHTTFDYLQRMLATRRGAMQFDFGTLRQLAAYSPVTLPGTEWIVAVKAPRSAVVTPLSTQMRTMFIVTTVLAVVGAVITATLWRDARRRIGAEVAARYQAETESMFKAMSEGVALHRLLRDARGRPVDYTILDVNAAYEKILGVPRESAINSRASERWGAVPFLEEYANVVATGEPITLETHFAPTNKTLSVSAVKTGPDSFATIITDLTEQRQLEQQFRQAQKMEAIGRLAGGVAHDFNNMLTAIIGFSELALAEMPPDAPYRADVEEVRKAGENAAAVARQLLAFSRRQIVQPQTLNLNEQVEARVRFLTRLIGEDVTIAVKTSREPAIVMADPSQIEQVLMNLAVNARDAMPNGGTLTIEIGRLDVDEAAASASIDAMPGRYVTLSVRDTGVGMSPEVLAHLFEPFFTTKERGKGTGLGLATVYGIVRQNGGFVRVESTVGQGSTFIVCLPAMGADIQEAAGAEVAAGGTAAGSILVVEDDPTVRHLTRVMLQRVGYTVEIADSAEEALDVLGRTGMRVDLVLTDIVMPGLSGTALAERLLSMPDPPRLLFMSGYTGDSPQHAIASGFPFIQKPFTAEGLTRKVREVLSATSV